MPDLRVLRFLLVFDDGVTSALPIRLPRWGIRRRIVGSDGPVTVMSVQLRCQHGALPLASWCMTGQVRQTCLSCGCSAGSSRLP